MEHYEVVTVGWDSMMDEQSDELAARWKSPRERGEAPRTRGSAPTVEDSDDWGSDSD
jgi:hypothetical protein